MGVNKNPPHVFVLPEDDANRQIANGFRVQLDPGRQRQMYVLKVAGGWIRVLDLFESVHIAEMGRRPSRSMVLLIDFDGDPNRIERARSVIPDDLAGRVFVLGSLREPQDLKADLGSYEKIGSDLATQCREGTAITWDHDLLRHNAGELDRLREYVRPILFPA